MNQKGRKLLMQLTELARALKEPGDGRGGGKLHCNSHASAVTNKKARMTPKRSERPMTLTLAYAVCMGTPKSSKASSEKRALPYRSLGYHPPAAWAEPSCRAEYWVAFDSFPSETRAATWSPESSSLRRAVPDLKRLM